MKVTYEITAQVEPSIASAYEEYMIRHHIPDLLATGHFLSATISKNGDRYRVRYEAESEAALDAYLSNDAPRLRGDFLHQFPESISLSRENWDVLAILIHPG